MSLTDRHRPTTLSEVLGQPDAVARLASFLAKPYPAAFIFHGPTGVGKTCTALAFANDLGIIVEQAEFSGLYQIASGGQTGESVRKAIDGLSLIPAVGSGWRMLLVNEADRVSEAAQFVWLDVLEDIPKKSVICFTTNALAKLPQRLRDRCEVIRFTGCKVALADSVRALVAKVWLAELGRDDPPDLAALGNLFDAEGNVSFRRVLQILAPVVRAGGALPPLVGEADGDEECCTNAVYWILGGAMVVLLGALSLAACVTGNGAGGGGRSWKPDDLLR